MQFYCKGILAEEQIGGGVRGKFAWNKVAQYGLSKCTLVTAILLIANRLSFV